MSIYCSFGIFAADDQAGDYPAPIVYRRSHVLPSADDPRGGSFELASIPAFLTRDGCDDSKEDGTTCWPYLRVSLNTTDPDEDTVVLDRAQVEALRDELTGWLDRVDPDLDPGTQPS